MRISIVWIVETSSYSSRSLRPKGKEEQRFSRLFDQDNPCSNPAESKGYSLLPNHNPLAHFLHLGDKGKRHPSVADTTRVSLPSTSSPTFANNARRRPLHPSSTPRTPRKTAQTHRYMNTRFTFFCHVAETFRKFANILNKEGQREFVLLNV